MIRVGVFGVGYLGRFHAQKYALMEDTELVGVVDTDRERARQVATEVSTRAFDDPCELIKRIDAASVVVPTVHHFEITRVLLDQGIHCLVEKPITTTLEQADALIALARDRDVVLQVGHLERFNPPVEVLYQEVTTPLFVEAHRLSPFKPRATDVDVVLDLMIHDIDIMLSLVKSPLKELRASGVPVLTQKVDIANARLIFQNGCTANLTASRISLNSMRRIRIFQPGAYLSADCAERTSLVVKKRQDLVNGPDPMAAIQPRLQHHGEKDILLEEIKSFARAVQGLEKPRVNGEAGREALRVALEINTRINSQLNALKQNLVQPA